MKTHRPNIMRHKDDPRRSVGRQWLRGGGRWHTLTEDGSLPTVDPIGAPAVTTCVTLNRFDWVASCARFTATMPPRLCPTSITGSSGLTPARSRPSTTPCS